MLSFRKNSSQTYELPQIRVISCHVLMNHECLQLQPISKKKKGRMKGALIHERMHFIRIDIEA